MSHVEVTITEWRKGQQDSSIVGGRKGGLRATVIQRGPTHGWPCCAQGERETEVPKILERQS